MGRSPQDRSTAPTGYPRARARTRAALVAAGQQVMAERGVEGATIAEIAERAGVSPGTFYNHFGDIPTLLDEVVDHILVELDATLAEVTALDRPVAERFAIGVQALLERAVADPVWGWCLVRVEPTADKLRVALHERVEGNVASGVASRHYAATSSPEAVADLLIGTLTMATRSLLDGRTTLAEAPATAELLLRALGVPAAEAGAVVRRALA